MEAKIGHIPYFLGRSLHAATDLLKEGLYQRLGNGKSIRIWGKKWLPKPSSYAIQSPVHILNREAKVQELFDRATGDWNRSLIQQIFTPNKANLICSLPLCHFGAEDRLI